jgi:hypothetical protein
LTIERLTKYFILSHQLLLHFRFELALPPILALTIYIYRKFINWNNSSKNKTDIELFQKFKLDEQSLILLNNSELFRNITKKYGSTVVIEKVLKCFDPHAAMLLYSKRPSYVRFNNLDYPCRPKYFFVLQILHYSQVFLCLLLFFISFLAFGILTINTTITYDSYFKLIFVFITSIVIYLLGFNFWWDEINVISRAEYFYQNFSIYFKKKHKDGLALVNGRKHPLDFEKNEWVEFFIKGKRQTLVGKIIKIEWITYPDTDYSFQKATIQLNLSSWMKKIFYLLISFAKNKNYRSLEFFLKESSFSENLDLESLRYPNDLMKWSCHQYEFLLGLQHKYFQNE